MECFAETISDTATRSSAVRDAARTPRHDGARTVRRRQDEVHPHADAGDDRVRRAAPRDADESEGDHRVADVRPT